ncbi:MAG: DoxX family protein [Chloroflexi bacterium]|nr:MAG: DoxX family protein [Chloroflexota bacterium]
MDTVALILQILLAVAFTGAGATKLLGAQMQIENFERWQISQSRRPLIGAYELLGALGMVVGIFVEEVAIAAGVWLAAAMVGALLTHRRINDLVSRYIPAFVLLILSVVVFALRAAEL